MKRIAAILILAILYVPAIKPTEGPLFMGMSPLLATPEKFNGRIVCIIGYLSISTESIKLYMYTSDYENAILDNAVNLQMTPDAARKAKEFDLEYVRVVGVFASKGVGHGIPDGILSQISSLTLWSDPKHPRTEKMKQLWKSP